ncbi:tungstate transport system permease protein [Thermodesulfovibrio aggregans]|uniref:Tungstate transport system permease protein n=1 Tax=Thermodesulfovibrio aggregans TaxID=86166 RepID=A0A0U9HMF1_9BACT|nr:ABC transporter permease [Thermodesulfovibrio aggregans]GAQ94256.1 tungstate transport system permease protein [Thermodesulfovibrio aggregans]
MNFIFEAFKQAFYLILHLDRELVEIILLSLKVSGTALAIATLLGIPVGALLGLKNFFGRNTLITLINTFMGLPPVVVGLFLYLMLSRSGPLGFLSLLYTPSAMIIAQSILAFPIVAGLSHSALIKIDPSVKLAAKTLGATPFQITLTMVREARYGIMAGVCAAFGRVMAEVGAILIVGGNIAGYTRVMTTTIALETDKGNFELAMALGIILLTISFAINIILFSIQKKGTKESIQWL